MSLDHFQVLPTKDRSHHIGSQQLLEAISHLYQALTLLAECEHAMEIGAYTLDFPSRLAESWLEVNKCRLYTENNPFMEENLIPVLGLISDAKSMFDSLVAWELGMTKHGFMSILNCIRNAALGIRPCLEELEAWLVSPSEASQTGENHRDSADTE
jgi:hypothetical protein